MQLVRRINQLIEANAVFVLARIAAAGQKSLIGQRFLVTSSDTVIGSTTSGESAGLPEDLIRTKAIELLVGEAVGVKTLWLHDNKNWDERKQAAELGVLFEIFRPQPELLICGAGHVGHATARLGLFLDFKVTVIDERVEFANRNNLPDEKIALIARDFDEALRDYKITPATSIVIVTRGHAQDETCLREVLNSQAGYIGMIGSKRRVAGVFERLIRDGFSRQQTDQVRAPIGLRIGARTPEEIAVAIMAEIISIRNAALIR